MKKFFSIILLSIIFTHTFSMILDSSDSASNRNFDSTLAIQSEIDSTVSESAKKELKDEDINENGIWFMYGFLVLGAVLVVLKFRGKL